MDGEPNFELFMLACSEACEEARHILAMPDLDEDTRELVATTLAKIMEAMALEIDARGVIR